MDGVILTPLKKIHNLRGYVFHAMKKSDIGFDGFGEAYFSTVNKKRGDETRLQVCYLQAIINSLSESYAPAWNSKHFAVLEADTRWFRHDSTKEHADRGVCDVCSKN